MSGVEEAIAIIENAAARGNHYVDLERLGLKSENMPEIVAKLAEHPEIVGVNLRFNQIGAVGTKELAKLTHLESLRLDWCELNDFALMNLGHLEKLKELDIRHNNIQGSGFSGFTLHENITHIKYSYRNEHNPLPKPMSLRLEHNKARVGEQNERRLAEIHRHSSQTLSDSDISDGLIGQISHIISTELHLEDSDRLHAVSSSLARLVERYDPDQSPAKAAQFKEKLQDEVRQKITSNFSEDLHQAATYDLKDNAGEEKTSALENALVEHIVDQMNALAFSAKKAPKQRTR